jgi:hypothetical protein
MEALIETLFEILPVICMSRLEFSVEFWLFPMVIPRVILPEVLRPSKGLKGFIFSLFREYKFPASLEMILASS